MRIIIKGHSCIVCSEQSCIHSKPYIKCKLGYFEVWQERTLSIDEFNKKFGKDEGLWESKGTKHCEVECRNSDCPSNEGEGHKHCRRRMKDEKFWYFDFNTLEDLVDFITRAGYVEMYIETQDGCGITIKYENQ